jgi:hypothetical protein
MQRLIALLTRRTSGSSFQVKRISRGIRYGG